MCKQILAQTHLLITTEHKYGFFLRIEQENDFIFNLNIIKKQMILYFQASYQ